MNAPAKVNVLAVLDHHIDVGEADHYIEYELREARKVVAELIAACKERDAAFAAWCSSAEREKQLPGPLYRRSRAADARYHAALARVGGDA